MKLEIVFKDGRKETFDDVASYNEVQEQTASEEHNAMKAEHTLTPIMTCMVNPMAINRDLFKNAWRRDCDCGRREELRKLIQKAFVELDNNPEKYASPFYIVLPEKDWDDERRVWELENYVKARGGYIADWVEQVLTWAQRISNGEAWEDVLRRPVRFCGKISNRLVEKKPGFYWLIGGEYNGWWCEIDCNTPICNSAAWTYDAVPVVAFREKITLPSSVRF